ncbi:MAG: spermidine/putrescine ABC transporter substrate-binding protein, partial [Clostridia bacterium]|nr:spermidine/putrescine ABC transporter substrate-binding protein [Clostridia bacterium]
MKKFLKIASLLLCLALVISCAFGCSGSSDEETGEDDNSSKSGKLYVFNWGDYIGEETIEKFEEKYPNIDVIYDIFDSNESMYQKLIGSNIPYDILVPSDYMIERLIRENRLKEIDMSKLENYHYIDEKCLNTIYDPENKYSVPYTYGTLGILYNTKMVEEEPHSWNTLWDEQYKGEILMLDQVRDTMCLALKRLGYSANSTDPEEIEAARQSLVEQKHLV